MRIVRGATIRGVTVWEAIAPGGYCLEEDCPGVIVRGAIV